MDGYCAPRIGLIHALEESIAPIHRAFAAAWPEANIFDLFDSSLAQDRAAAGSLNQEMIDRFLALGRYAAGCERKCNRADALLFTCSAFGAAISEVQRELPIPVLRPNEAAFARALDHGNRIGLVVTFEPSLSALSDELQQMAARRGATIEIAGRFAPGALDALRAGYAGEHDHIVNNAAMALGSVDVIILGQFSTARAAPVLQTWSQSPVFTTPSCAVNAAKAAVGIQTGRA